MIEVSPLLATIIMFGGLLLLVLTGYPMGLILIILGTGFGFLLLGPGVFEMFRYRSYNLLASFIFMAVPLFVFMGAMVESSGVAEKLFNALYILTGRFRGGLAIGTILLGTILAACVGVIAASVVTMGLLAMPTMVKKGYDRGFAAGAVCAGGSLGILIPPSVMLVVYGPTAGISVGKLFMAAFPAGLLLSVLYIAYAAVRAYLQKDLAPAVPASERSATTKEKLIMIPTSLLPPLVLMMAVLGSIFFGVASPTEAAGVGALASAVLAMAYKQFNMKVLNDAMLTTMRTTCMVMIIGLGAGIFTGVFDSAGGVDVVTHAIMSAPFGRWGAFAAVMFIVFVLGMFIDWLGIVFLMVPIATPIGTALGFDPLWFAMMIIINFQMSFITPPFAYAIFYLKGIAKPEWGLTTQDIIRGVLPYVGLIIFALVLCIAFPQILLWLPAQMIT
ncbi:MAG: TRAP transporter large permease subunit [Dehalococcoidia bacterium]|nr:TRAP transporter large permease subunit [Dehalococcoidia bacterium]